MLKRSFTESLVEVGVDEAGRGCLFGPVCVGAVVWSPEISDPRLEWIRDSKRLSESKRKLAKEFILEKAVAWSVQFVSPEEIDDTNILQSTMMGMHRCIDDIRSQLDIDLLLIDGDKFKIYTDENLEPIDHTCVVGGDNLYQSIAAASILAKTFRDEYILDLCQSRPELKLYDIQNNKGYGTKPHMNTLRERGPVDGHRYSFKPCYPIQN